jgi:DNA-binding XRE family transcriptional regulator
VKQLIISESFSRELKMKRRVELDTDVRTAAKKIGISPATLSRCENGSLPDLLTYAALCKWLGQSMDSFIAYKGSSKKK